MDSASTHRPRADDPVQRHAEDASTHETMMPSSEPPALISCQATPIIVEPDCSGADNAPLSLLSVATTSAESSPERSGSPAERSLSPTQCSLSPNERSLSPSDRTDSRPQRAIGHRRSVSLDTGQLQDLSSPYLSPGWGGHSSASGSSSSGLNSSYSIVRDVPRLLAQIESDARASLLSTAPGQAPEPRLVRPASPEPRSTRPTSPLAAPPIVADEASGGDGVVPRSEGTQPGLPGRPQAASPPASRSLSASPQLPPPPASPPAPHLYGTRIGEDHKNFVLMYDMLTGIRIVVSRTQAKAARPIVAEDYTATHKLAFDMGGDEMTPSSKYDFKFKDYAPWVFRDLRELFRIDPAEYLISLTGRYVLSEQVTPGKSGSFFYYSQDYRFIIKTIRHGEHTFLRRILRHYHEHVRAHPNTLLARFIGLHRVKLPHGRKIHFVVMGNIFPPNKDIHEIYDLKGSTLGRQVPADELRANPRLVQKDLNWVNKGLRLRLGPVKRAALLEQLALDVALLTRLRIMDYSLLVGIHYQHRGNRERLRDRGLALFEGVEDQVEAQAGLAGPSSAAATGLGSAPSMRKRAARAVTVVRRGPRDVDGSEVSLASGDGAASLISVSDAETFLPSERRFFKFYCEQGGLLSTDERDRPRDELYFLGIIDILTPYGLGKRLEHAIKSLNYDRNAISAIEPDEYAHRFSSFMRDAVLRIDAHGRLLKHRRRHSHSAAGADDDTIQPADSASEDEDAALMDGPAAAVAMSDAPTVEVHVLSGLLPDADIFRPLPVPRGSMRSSVGPSLPGSGASASADDQASLRPLPPLPPASPRL